MAKLIDLLSTVPYWVKDYYRQRALARRDWDSAFATLQKETDEAAIEALYENIDRLDDGHRA